MYLNKAKMTRTAIMASIQLVVGIMLFAFFAFGFIATLTGDIEDADVGIPLSVIGMLIFGFMIFLSVRNRVMRSAATRLNLFFELDADGVIPAEQLVSVLNAKDPWSAMKKAEKVIGRGFLKNCSADGNGMRILLFSRYESAGVYEPVSCPGCGATGQRRAGYTYECPYCGTSIK